MSEETRKQAIAKLNAFGQKIGYPDKWIDYSALNVSRDSTSRMFCAPVNLIKCETSGRSTNRLTGRNGA